MTVSTASRRAGPYIGNSIATSFSFAFRVFTVDDLRLYRTVLATGEETALTRGVDYSVALNVDQSVTPGGAVTYPLSGSPMASTHSLIMISNVAYDQQTALPTGGAYRAEIVERAFDKVTILAQQLQDGLTRTIRTPELAAGLSELADAPDRALKLLAFDAAGDVTLVVPSDQSAATLALHLDDDTDAARGAGMVAFDPGVEYPAGSVGARLRPTDRSLEDFGGVGDGVEINANNAAWAAARSWMATAIKNKALHVNPGHFKFSEELTLLTTTTQVRISGVHSGVSILQQTDNTKNAIAVPSGATCHTIDIENLSIHGAGYASGTTKGIYVGSVATPAFRVTLRGLYLYSLPGQGVHILDQFTTRIVDCQVDDIGGHGFDVEGANTTVFESCYAHRMRGTAKAGYRVHSGVPIFIACNGVDSGEYWGIFGDSVADDGILQYCHPVLDGCNVEDFTVVGVHCKSSGMTSRRSGFLAPATGTVTALLINPSNNPGHLDLSGSFGTKGASWLNSQPLHTLANGAPFLRNASNLDDQLSWYNRNTSTTQTVPNDRYQVISSNTYATSPLHHYTRGWNMQKYSGIATLSAGTVAVTFATALPSANYSITLAGNANETFRWASKATGGFTINSSNAGSTATVDWSAVLNG